jgi:hypothetical protein
MDFNPGNGTLKSTSVEAALAEAMQLLELAEEASATPNEINFTDVSHNNASKVLNLTCNMPFELTTDVDGGSKINAVNYVSFPFVGGGDLKATTLPTAVLELAQKVQIKERSSTANRNLINLTYVTDTGVCSIIAAFDAVRSVSATGSIDTVAKPYLT